MAIGYDSRGVRNADRQTGPFPVANAFAAAAANASQRQHPAVDRAHDVMVGLLLGHREARR